jgi:hypothetical protein
MVRKRNFSMSTLLYQNQIKRTEQIPECGQIPILLIIFIYRLMKKEEKKRKRHIIAADLAIPTISE